MNRIIFAVFLVMTATYSLADMYEYEDSNGVLHFTDDPSKVPPKSKKKNRDSFSEREKRLVETINQYQETHDIPVKDIKRTKKELADFYEINKEHLADIDQKPDYRLSSPEGTIKMFITALQSGNKDDLRSTVTLSCWQDNGFKTAEKAQFAEVGNKMASSTTQKLTQDGKRSTFELTEKTNSPNRMVRRIELVYQYGNWKINKL